MSPLFAASIFDSPLIIVAIVVISMIANWLSKRRQEKAPEPRQPGPPAPRNAEEELDFEEVLRRLMRGEPAQKPPAPPPVPPPRRREPPPEGIWIEQRTPPPIRQSAGLVKLPPLPPPQQVAATLVEGEGDQDVAAKIAALREHARMLSAGVRRSRGKRVSYAWRNPRKAREAFVASLVFGPPKAMEP